MFHQLSIYLSIIKIVFFVHSTALHSTLMYQDSAMRNTGQEYRILVFLKPGTESRDGSRRYETFYHFLVVLNNFYGLKAAAFALRLNSSCCLVFRFLSTIVWIFLGVVSIVFVSSFALVEASVGTVPLMIIFLVFFDPEASSSASPLAAFIKLRSYSFIFFTNFRMTPIF